MAIDTNNNIQKNKLNVNGNFSSPSTPYEDPITKALRDGTSIWTFKNSGSTGSSNSTGGSNNNDNSLMGLIEKGYAIIKETGTGTEDCKTLSEQMQDSTNTVNAYLQQCGAEYKKTESTMNSDKTKLGYLNTKGNDLNSTLGSLQNEYNSLLGSSNPFGGTSPKKPNDDGTGYDKTTSAYNLNVGAPTPPPAGSSNTGDDNSSDDQSGEENEKQAKLDELKGEMDTTQQQLATNTSYTRSTYNHRKTAGDTYSARLKVYADYTKGAADKAKGVVETKVDPMKDVADGAITIGNVAAGASAAATATGVGTGFVPVLGKISVGAYAGGYGLQTASDLLNKNGEKAFDDATKGLEGLGKLKLKKDGDDGSSNPPASSNPASSSSASSGTSNT